MLLHQSLNAKYMAMDGFVIQNTNRSVATAGMCAHGVVSNEYGTATLHRPFPHELAATVQSDGVAHGGSAGMNLLTWMTVNSLACAHALVKHTRFRERKTPQTYIKTAAFRLGRMTNEIVSNTQNAEPTAPNLSVSANAAGVRRVSHGGAYKTISFETVTSGLMVRTTDDGHLLALDFLSTLTNGDRKKASQTLARIASRPDTVALLTLRRVASKPKPRKLVSFSNAIQLLLVLPKRTVCMDTRRTVAGVLTDHFEYRYQQQDKSASSRAQLATSLPSDAAFPQFSAFFKTDEERRVTLRQAEADLTQREMELEHQRMRLPLDRLNQCMGLMERCGPMTEEEQRKFRTLISEQAAGA